MKTAPYVTPGASEETNRPAGDDDDDDDTRQRKTKTIQHGQTRKQTRMIQRTATRTRAANKRTKQTTRENIRRKKPLGPARSAGQQKLKQTSKNPHPHSTTSNSVELPPQTAPVDGTGIS